MKRKFSLLPFVIIITLLLLLNWYFLSGIYFLFPSVFTKPIAISLNIIGLLSFLGAMSRMSKHGMDNFFKFAIHFFFTLIAAEIVFIAVNFLGDLIRFILAIFGHHSASGAFLPDKIWAFSYIAFTLFVITIALFIDGMWRGKYAYRIIKQTLYFDDLPTAFDGFTITQISDVHAGSFKKPKAVQKGVELINAQQSDLFVFTGDLVNNKSEEIKPWISTFSKISAPFGKFSILGNHDYGDYVKWPNELEKTKNLDALKQHHQEIGFRLLLDEHIEIEKDNEKIVLAGVENWGLGFGERGDLKKALSGTNKNDFKILLSHDPSHWESQVKNFPSNIQLTLSGHTHGMQFGIEAFGIKWSPVKYRYKHWAGLKEEFDRFLYINRGFGFIGFSGRVGIWPEITVLELKKK